MTPTLYTPRLRECLRFVEHAHRGQERKGSGDSPYLLHPVAVAIVLERAGATEVLGPDIGEVICLSALLHDVYEDTEVGLEEIERRFGDGVAATVARLTKPAGASPTSAEVEEALISEEAVMVKAADLIVNLGDIVTDVSEHGLGHLRGLFGDPAAKLDSYLELARLLIDRLKGCPLPLLRDELVSVRRQGEELRAAHTDLPT